MEETSNRYIPPSPFSPTPKTTPKHMIVRFLITAGGQVHERVWGQGVSYPPNKIHPKQNKTNQIITCPTEGQQPSEHNFSGTSTHSIVTMIEKPCSL